MGGVKIVGLEKLQKKLKKNARMEDVKRVVRHNGSQLQAGIQSNADFSKGYQTGATKRSLVPPPSMRNTWSMVLALWRRSPSSNLPLTSKQRNSSATWND